MLFLFPLNAGTVRAEDRALLIGVGTYEMGVILPGIQKDIRMMEEAVYLMGFEKGQVRILRDQDATLQGIRQSIRMWLSKGVEADDRVLLYFSGHGSQIKDRSGDEADGADEVLLPYDVAVQGKNLEGAFLDDEFGRLLSDIPARLALVILDTCHSGTATKNLPLSIKNSYGKKASDSAKEGEVVSKVFSYEGMPRTKAGFASDETSENERYIALAASQDHEEAVATTKGSLFTQGILESLREASQKDEELTIGQLNERATLFITQNLPNKGKLHHPRMTGNLQLAHLKIRSAEKSLAPEGTLWGSLFGFADEAKVSVSLTLNKRRFRVGDPLILTCETRSAGYLNIINVGQGEQEAVVLFPNKLHPDNRVEANAKMTVPSQSDPFELRAQPPPGKSMIVVFFTRENINAYKMDNRGDTGHFAMLSDRFLERLRKTKEKTPHGFGAVKIITEVYE